MTRKLSPEQVSQQINILNDWTLDKNAIKKEWTFEDFNQALTFINKIGQLAEKHDHHPEIFNVYNRVALRFYTHTAGGLTEKDFNIARDIDSI